MDNPWIAHRVSVNDARQLNANHVYKPLDSKFCAVFTIGDLLGHCLSPSKRFAFSIRCFMFIICRIDDRPSLIIGEYGSDGYPFTPERVKEIKDQEEDARKNQTLRSLLESPSRDFIIKANGNKVPVTEFAGKTVGLYFILSTFKKSSDFTSVLVKVYNELKAKDCNFEIVMIPLDDDEESFKKELDSVPWFSLPFKDKKCEKLVRYFELSTLPTVVILGPDGKTLHPNAADAIEEHGVNAYPFTPDKFSELEKIEKAKLEAQTLESVLVSEDLDFVVGKDGAKTITTETRGLIMLHGAEAFPFTDERRAEIEAGFANMAKGLPDKVKHDSHQEHELVLTRSNAYVCDGCDKEGKIWAYNCEECNFDLHPECAIEKDDGKPNGGWVCDGEDTLGTQVLIPVNGGMIELYISKQVTRDQEMIEVLTARFNIFSRHFEQLKTGGSPNCSNPWSENSSLVSAGSTQVSPTQSIDMPINLLGYAISDQPKEHTKNRQNTSKDHYQSKNLLTERNRRNRIKDGLFALRALVPKISKMDRASIVGDAIDYIKELQANVQELKKELERLEEDDSQSHVDEIEVCKPRKPHELSPIKGHNLVSTTPDRKTQVQVEVHQIGAKNFLLKLVYSKQRGAFLRIIKTVNSLGLQVLDVNVTTCYGKVLNILKVEAKEKDFAAKSLKDSLLDSWMPRILDENPTRSD
ncbi:hypothetical protein E3N88_43393 [Mikania micrantha]|uniref:protein-disulfide reductase n=1 Tax=Mikania micrantha TaxID=192012 RepID=A0A5N6LF21_9ASTR|nr:hypothetical protein E3N88_43393 [Mikania micrantha]